MGTDGDDAGGRAVPLRAGSADAESPNPTSNPTPNATPGPPQPGRWLVLSEVRLGETVWRA